MSEKHKGVNEPCTPLVYGVLQLSLLHRRGKRTICNTLNWEKAILRPSYFPCFSLVCLFLVCLLSKRKRCGEKTIRGILNVANEKQDL